MLTSRTNENLSVANKTSAQTIHLERHSFTGGHARRLSLHSAIQLVESLSQIQEVDKENGQVSTNTASLSVSNRVFISDGIRDLSLAPIKV